PALARAPRLRVALELDRDRALESETVDATISLTAEDAEHVVVYLDLPAELATVSHNPRGLALAAGEERTIELPLRCERWGARGTLDLSVRAATSLAHRYLQRKDRVGLVSFGGFLSWLEPESGTRQLYRIVDSLLQMDIVLSYAARNVNVLPPRSLPPKALVLALTPLLDPRTAAALLDLRARSFDLVVVEVSPVPFVDPGAGELEQLSYRLWRLSREALRARYRQ